MPQWRTLRPKQYPVLAPTCQKRHAPHLSDLHKSLQIWGWFLPKKIDLPTQGGGVKGQSGNFRGSKNQNSGKCHELSRKSIKQFFFTHPTLGGGGVGGQNFKSPVIFMNCRENR